MNQYHFLCCIDIIGARVITRRLEDTHIIRINSLNCSFNHSLTLIFTSLSSRILPSLLTHLHHYQRTHYYYHSSIISSSSVHTVIINQEPPIIITHTLTNIRTSHAYQFYVMIIRILVVSRLITSL